MKKRKNFTASQIWAQKRNWNKLQLSGIKNVLKFNHETLVLEERKVLNLMHQDITILLNLWNGRNTKSKEQFLKRKNKI